MATYSIRTIALCEGPRDKSMYTYRMNIGTICNTVCYVWYIEGSDPKILIDAGANALTFTKRGAEESDIMSIEDGLTKLDLKPEDIELVIVTHMHCDHMALSHLYKNARFIVQKEEFDYAKDPHPIDAHLFENNFEELELELIDGQKEIIPGLSVFPTPGHTPGGQSVEVDTRLGNAVIPGFCCLSDTFSQTEEMKHMGWEVAVPLIHHDIRKLYDSVVAVKQRADIVIGNHDPAYMSKEAIPQKAIVIVSKGKVLQ
ncbi:N-acyl homoserine lactonase family protein [Thermodesulfobacteriota bacterium]